MDRLTNTAQGKPIKPEGILYNIQEPLLNGLTALLALGVLANIGSSLEANYHLRFKGKTPDQIEQSWQNKSSTFRYITAPGRHFEYLLEELRKSYER